MRRVFAASFGFFILAACAAAEPVPYARHLALSPDGNELAFSWAGDIWVASSRGGPSRRLTVHPANETHPVWSRDGKRIAFASDRHGSNNVFTITPDGMNLTRITFSDRSEVPTDWTLNDEEILFSSRKNGEVEWEEHTYRVPADGGQAWEVMSAYGHGAQLSPDGRQLAFTRGAERWWRTGYRGSANWDIWLRDMQTGDYRQLTDFEGTDRLPFWASSGEGVYMLSDRGGLHDVWYLPLNGNPRQITRAGGHRVRDYTVSRDGRRMAYTVWDKVFVQELPGGVAREIELQAGDDLTRLDTLLRSYTRDASDAAVSPDGKEFAVIIRGEIFVGSTDDNRPTRRVTQTSARERDLEWSPDGKALFFISDLPGLEAVYRAVSAEDGDKRLCESLRFRVERVTESDQAEMSPQVSPDGKTLMFYRERGDVWLRELKSGKERRLLESFNVPDARWSADSKWIAYAVNDANYNSDVWIVPADGSAEPVNISRHPDNDVNPRWSADGQVLAFNSRRQGLNSDVYMVFLSRDLDEKSNSEHHAYFGTAAEAAGKRKPPKSVIASGSIRLAGQVDEEPVASSPAEETAGDEPDSPKDDLAARLRAIIKELLAEKDDKSEKAEEPSKDARTDKPEKYAWSLDDAYLRVRRVTSLPDSTGGLEISPSGAELVFLSRHTGSPALYEIKWNGEDLKSIRSGTLGRLQYSIDGKRLNFLAGGQSGSIKAGGGDAKTYGHNARMAISHTSEAAQKWHDAARYMGRWFYHPTMKDLPWDDLTREYGELALRTRTWSEFGEVFDQLQGLLNASHLGMRGPGEGGEREGVGYLGTQFDPDHSGEGLRITHVTPRTAADRAESRLGAGDVLLDVNGMAVGRGRSIEEALLDSVGQEVIVRYRPAPPEGSADAAPEPREMVIRPQSYGQFAAARYEEWVATNRRYVEEKSEGKVAYVHIAGMGEPQFHTFERDLYAAAHGKDGLIIDVRNNGGGWTADWVMAVLSVRPHAYTVGRGGAPGYPQDRLIFYSWTKPATMMCNQFSYSNAEIISHAFKNTGRGPLVGVTTWGAVISTGSYQLIDGATIRMPFRGWYTLPHQEDMENQGAEPTIPMPRTPADEDAGRFPQLDAAIQATLEQIAEAGETLRGS